VEIVDGPKIVSKPACHYVGIRVVTPFRGMFAVRDKLMEELHAWLDERDTHDRGHTFFRLHVIDMEGPMDIELGVITKEPVTGDDRVHADVLPAGDYASLTYVNHARRANRMLLEWVRDNGIKLDRWDEPAGDHFACRYEAYLTDPRSERMKTKWQVDLSILIARD
jgi:effector-binding domain-containing protein